jgi:hypothetical protein
VPTSSDVVNQTASGRVAQLLALPMLGTPPSLKVALRQTPGGVAAAVEAVTVAGSASAQGQPLACVKPRLDTALMTCLHNCGHSSIKSMIRDNVVEIPKVNGKDNCLA